MAAIEQILCQFFHRTAGALHRNNHISLRWTQWRGQQQLRESTTPLMGLRSS